MFKILIKISTNNNVSIMSFYLKSTFFPMISDDNLTVVKDSKQLGKTALFQQSYITKLIIPISNLPHVLNPQQITQLRLQ